MSWASREQGALTAGDVRLTRDARKLRPLAQHWWGVRMQQRPTTWCAVCWLHENPVVITTWQGPTQERARFSPSVFPADARSAVLIHRLEHFAALRKQPSRRRELLQPA